MINFLIRYKLIVAGLIIGATGGYLYYYFVGCASGTCSITSRPFNSTAYGALMGVLFFSLFQKGQPHGKSKKREDEKK